MLVAALFERFILGECDVLWLYPGWLITKAEHPASLHRVDNDPQDEDLNYSMTEPRSVDPRTAIRKLLWNRVAN